MKNGQLYLLLIILLLPSCMLITYSPIIKKTDKVKNIRTVRLKLNFLNAKEWRSPLVTSSKHFYKEISQGGNSSYFVYDILELKELSSTINDTIFLIIDEHIFPIKVQERQTYGKTIKRTKTDNILTSDSTTTTVITGYREENRMVEKIKYQLGNKEIEAIKNAKKLKFRYYSEPEMITIKISHLNLMRIKRFISKD